MTWKERLIGIPLAVFGAVLLAVTGAGMTLTRTDWGREQVRAYLLDKLNGAIRGRVEIEAVLEGDLLHMVRMAGVRIYEADGSIFADVDTVNVHYRWSDFLVGDVTLAGVTLVSPVVNLRTEPGVGWNFTDVFRSSGSSPDSTDSNGGRRRTIVLREVSIRSGDVYLRTPWDPRGTDPDSSRWFLERNGEGWDRVFRLERLNATLPLARVEAPADVGRFFQIVQLSSRASIVGEPIEIEQLKADITARHDTLSFQLYEADLPDTQLSIGEGWVTLVGDPEYAFAVRGNDVNTRDLQWLIPQLPTGLTNLDFRFHRTRDRVEIEAQDASWRSADGVAVGRFAMTLNRYGTEGVRFDDVDVDVERVATELIESLTGWAAPVAAELRGHVKLDGPLSELQLVADVDVEPVEAIRPAHVAATGMVGIGREAYGAGSLSIQVDSVDLDLVRAFVPDLAPRGIVSGGAWLDGRLSEGLTIDSFWVEQRDGAFAPTRLSGGGTIRSADTVSPAYLNLRLAGESVSLTTLSEYYPAIPFRGDFTGNFRAVGRLDDLGVYALIRGVEDSLLIEGTVRLAGDVPRYEGTVKARRVTLPEFREGIPPSDIDFMAYLEGSGASVDELEARGRVDLQPSYVGGVGFDSAGAVLRVADGLLQVDSALVAGEFGELEVSGALSLIPDVADSLRIQLRADSLGALNPWLFPALDALAVPSFDIAQGEAGETAPASRVEGIAILDGWLVRDSLGVVLRGNATVEGLTYADVTADSIRVSDFEFGSRGGRLDMRGQVVAREPGLGGLEFRELSFTGEHTGAVTSLDFRMFKEGVETTGRLSMFVGEEGRRIELDTLTLGLAGTQWGMVRPTVIDIAPSGALSVDGLEIRSAEGLVTLAGGTAASGPVSMAARFQGLDLAKVALLWTDAPETAGTLDLDLELTGRVRSPVVTGNLEISDGRLFGVDFTRLAGTVGYEDGNLTLDLAARESDRRLVDVRGTFPIDLTLPGFNLAIPEREMDLRVDGDSIPLKLANLITDQITDLRGHARASMLAGGTPRAIHLGGAAALVDGGFRVIRSGITYRQLRGDVRFDGNVVEVRDVSFRGPQGGGAAVGGTVTFNTLRNPEFDLRLHAQRIAAYDQLDANAIVSGTVDLDGPYEQPTLNGDLSIISAVFFVEEIGRQAEIIDPFVDLSLIDSLFPDVRVPTVSPFLENLTMDLDFGMRQDTWLRSAEMNVEIAGELSVQKRPGEEEWRIIGTLQAVRGDYRFFNKRFAVTSGTIDFVGTGTDPGLRIVSLYTVQTQKQPIEIRLIIGGTLKNMELTLQSDHQPPIPESDLFSYLLFGRPSYELTRTGQERSLLDDVTSGVPQAFLGYALSSLLVGEAGIAYVDVSRVSTTNSEGEYRSGVGPALTATQVEVGWYLAPSVFMSVAQNLVGTVRPTVRVDWRLDDRFTLRGLTEPRFGREGVLYYGGPGTTAEQSIGVFLFYGWAY